MSGHAESRTVTNNFVYRLHGADGEVIYVGRSVNVARRISKHNTFPRKPWIEDVRSVSMFGPMSREEAIAAERREIGRLQPPGNIALTARDHRPFVAHMSKQAAAGPVVGNVHIDPPPPRAPHPCEVGRHRWAWLADGRQACGHCGRPR